MDFSNPSPKEIREWILVIGGLVLLCATTYWLAHNWVLL
jgi:hypothetical protein